MRIGQQVVTGGNKYSFPMPNANNNLVIFDVHNDSPYNVGVSLGTDTGINNCDYYTSPHGAIFGISPFGASHKSIGGSRWNGTIFVYTETPAGAGGTTNLASAPASSVTVLGYPQGYQPQNQIALNRMQTTANTVQTAGNVAATSVVNDNNPAATQWAEATQSGGPASNVLGTVDGSIQFNQWDGTTKKLLFQTIANAAANNPAVKMLAAGMFAEVVGSLLIDQNLTIANNQAFQYKDNAGTARRVFQVDNNDNTQIFGITGLDLIQMLSSGGVLGIVFDMINKSLDIKTTATQVVGTTNGTATLYQFLTGTNVKAFCIFFNAYRNASVTSQIITLPVAFTAWAQWLAGNAAFITPRSGGSNLTNACRVLTALASGGGTNTTTSLLPPKSLGEIIQGFDSFDLGNTQGSNNSSLYFFIGQ